MTSDPLADAHALGVERWPGVVIDRDRFAAFVTARCGELELAVVRCEQLYLTCACTAGDPVALATFERTFGPVIDSALARMANAVTDADEVKQQVRERLFVGAAETPPRIAEYTGRGDLAGWVARSPFERARSRLGIDVGVARSASRTTSGCRTSTDFQAVIPDDSSREGLRATVV